jgi:hypothetical protein
MVSLRREERISRHTNKQAIAPQCPTPLIFAGESKGNYQATRIALVRTEYPATHAQMMKISDTHEALNGFLRNLLSESMRSSPNINYD